MAMRGSRLLNILCLHGYGGNAAVFEHQSRIFRKTFAGSMTFHILQAPAEVNDQPVPAVYAARGLLPPYYGWYRIGQPSTNEHGQHELKVTAPAPRLRYMFVSHHAFVTCFRTSTCPSASRRRCSCSRTR